MPSFDRYMAQYDHEHTNPWNKILHGIGIPIIIAGIVLAVLTFWRTGLALFVGGWILLFAGHRIEGNKPAFFQGVIYFLVGPIWIAKELKDAISWIVAAVNHSALALGPLIFRLFGAQCALADQPHPGHSFVRRERPKLPFRSTTPAPGTAVKRECYP